MGRNAEGWKLVWKPTKRGRIAHVRFRVNGVRYEYTTEQATEGPAVARAEVIYASAVAGKHPRKRVVRTGGRTLDDLTCEWLDGLLLAPKTIEGYEIYARQWIAFFRTLGAISTPTARAYYAHRLRSVLRITVRKELSALRTFVAWCKGKGELEEAPVIPIPERNVVGTRSSKTRKTAAVELSAVEMRRVLKALPAEGKKWKGRKRTPRAFFTVLWETGLRPITVHRLEVGRHYRKGGKDITITADIDKARYARVIGLTPEARAALDAVCPKDGLLFPPCDFRRTLKAAGARAGLPAEKVAHLSRYDVRHARVTDFIDETGDMLGAAYLVGHKLVSTTDKYAHPSRRAGDRVVQHLSGAKRVLRRKKEKSE